MTETSWATDSFEAEVTVTVDPGGAAKNLTGATVATLAAGPGGTVAGTATVTDAANGVIAISFDAGDLSAGIWRVQVRVTLSGEVQTVYDDTVQVRASVVAA